MTPFALLPLTDGCEALILMTTKELKMCNQMWSAEHGPRKLLDLVDCFHPASRMETQYSQHVRYVCTCPTFWKIVICKHVVAFTLMTDKNFSLPPHLDERRLEKHDNARAAAKAFAVGKRKKDVESRKRALLASDDEDDAPANEVSLPHPLAGSLF